MNPGLSIGQGDYVGVDLLDSTSSLALRTVADSRFTYRFWSPLLADGTTLPGNAHPGIREMLYQVTTTRRTPRA